MVLVCKIINKVLGNAEKQIWEYNFGAEAGEQQSGEDHIMMERSILSFSLVLVLSLLSVTIADADLDTYAIPPIAGKYPHHGVIKALS